jgi:hypothetical protein
LKQQGDFITEPEQILRELERSKIKGNVLGICAGPFGKSMCLTAIDDIQNIESEHTHDKLVTLKKYDLQGSFIDTNELCLSEITKVQPFRRKYNDSYSLFFRSDFEKTHGDYVVKIRRMEQSISFHELQIILIKIINSGYRITIHTWNETESPVSCCYVRDFMDGKFDTVIISYGIEDDFKKNVLLEEIESIEFETFFYYKGFSSKVFRVG